MLASSHPESGVLKEDGQARQISTAAVQQSAGIGQIKDAMYQLSVSSKDTTSAARNLESAVENIFAIARRLNKVVTG